MRTKLGAAGNKFLVTMLRREHKLWSRRGISRKASREWKATCESHVKVILSVADKLDKLGVIDLGRT